MCFQRAIRCPVTDTSNTRLQMLTHRLKRYYMHKHYVQFMIFTGVSVFCNSGTELLPAASLQRPATCSSACRATQPIRSAGSASRSRSDGRRAGRLRRRALETWTDRLPPSLWDTHTPRLFNWSHLSISCISLLFNLQPPPPGYAPNAAQLAASQGNNVVVTQRQGNFWEGSGDGGVVMW